MTKNLEFGLDTFGDVTTGADGGLLPQPQVIRNVIEEAVLADRPGIDFFGVGEHHRKDCFGSSCRAGCLPCAYFLNWNVKHIFAEIRNRVDISRVLTSTH